MAYTDFLAEVHGRTKRDYLGRVNETPKVEAAVVAKQFGRDYWDGDRKYGYGGFHYDGRWQAVANAMRDHYGLKSGMSVLDVGCGKGFLLYDLAMAVPGLSVTGIDISTYALEHAKPEIRECLQVASAEELPFDDADFDLVISVNTLHNLACHELDKALREIERVGRCNKYICVESYRSETEKVNLLYWQLTCESFFSPEEWQWWFDHSSYTGDHSFIYFE